MSNYEIAVVTACESGIDQDLIFDAYASLRRQTGARWQWVIVYDHPSGVPGWLAALAASDERIIAAHNPSTFAGPATCRNLGTLHATAPLVRNLDADDMLYGEDALAGDVTALSQSGIDFVLSPAVDLGMDGEVTVPKFSADIAEPRRIERGTARRYTAARGPGFGVAIGTLTVRRKTYWLAGGTPALPISEDRELLRSISRIAEGWVRPEPTMAYRKRPGSITDGATDFTAADWSRDILADLLGDDA